MATKINTTKVNKSKVIAFLRTHTVEEAAESFELSLGRLHSVIVEAADLPRYKATAQKLLVA